MKNNKHKPNKLLTNKELEEKIIGKYNKVNPQPLTLKERVVKELKK